MCKRDIMGQSDGYAKSMTYVGHGRRTARFKFSLLLRPTDRRCTFCTKWTDCTFAPIPPCPICVCVKAAYPRERQHTRMRPKWILNALHSAYCAKWTDCTFAPPLLAWEGSGARLGAPPAGIPLHPAGIPLHCAHCAKCADCTFVPLLGVRNQA